MSLSGRSSYVGSSKLDPVLASFSPLGASKTGIEVGQIQPRTVTPKFSTNLGQVMTLQSSENEDPASNYDHHPRSVLSERHKNASHSRESPSGPRFDKIRDSLELGRLSISGRLSSTSPSALAPSNSRPDHLNVPSGIQTPSDPFKPLRPSLDQGQPRPTQFADKEPPLKEIIKQEPANSAQISHLVREIVKESISNELNTLRNDVHNLHVDIIKRDIAQQNAIRNIFEEILPTTMKQIMEELRVLREENARLRLKYDQ